MKPDMSQPGGSGAQLIKDRSADDQTGPAAQGVEQNALNVPEMQAVIKRVGGKENASSKIRRSIVFVILAVLLVAGSTLAYQNYVSKSSPSIAAGAKEPPVVTVTTAPAAVRSVEDTVAVTGSVTAWDPLSVGAEISGLRINQVNVEEGDSVKKGQALVVLNSALIKAQLDQARARLASSEANLKKAIQPNRPEDILALEAAYSQSEASVAQERAHFKQARENLANAEINARRAAELSHAGAISMQESETKQLAAETAKEELKSAEQKVRAAQFTSEQAHQRWLIAARGGRSEDVDISKAAIAETKAQIEHLQEQLAQTIIRAPDDGLISRRDAHIGDITSTGTPLFSIIRLHKLELKAQVSDIELAKFKAGQKVKISRYEDDESNIFGTVQLVSPQVDPASRLGIVRIALPNNVGLKPGMFVRAQVCLGTRQAITVPPVSVVTRNGESFVFKLEGNRAISCPVKTGIHADQFVEIKNGVKAGTLIIAKGARFLSDRDVVQVGL